MKGQTLRERYPKLQDKAFVMDMFVESVDSSMRLENQEVPLPTLRQMAEKVLGEY